MEEASLVSLISGSKYLGEIVIVGYFARIQSAQDSTQAYNLPDEPSTKMDIVKISIPSTSIKQDPVKKRENVFFHIEVEINERALLAIPKEKRPSTVACTTFFEKLSKRRSLLITDHPPRIISISKRFSEFRQFHRDWSSLYPNISFSLPPKVWIGNKRPEVIEFRRKELESYLGKIAGVSCLSGKLGSFLKVEPEIFDLSLRVTRVSSSSDVLFDFNSFRPVVLTSRPTVSPQSSPVNRSTALVSPAYEEISSSTRGGTQETVLQLDAVDSVGPTSSTSNLFSQRKAKVIAPYQPDSEDSGALQLSVGETIFLEDWKDELNYPGWHYAWNAQGMDGYVHQDFISIEES